MTETPGWQAPSAGSLPPYGGWTSPPGALPTEKPGIVPLRPLSAGEVLDGGFATIRQNPKLVFGYAAAFAAVLQLARALVGIAMRDFRASAGCTP